MKTFLYALLLWSVGFSAPDCLGDYTLLASRIERSYVKAKADFEKTSKGHYEYEFSPVSMFPFFCLDKKPDLSKYKLKNLCNHATNVYEYKDSINQHVILSMHQYIRLGKLPSQTRTYTLYFYMKNKSATVWVGEKKPIVVTFTWNRKLQQYNCP
jgi:hypothetical protein